MTLLNREEAVAFARNHQYKLLIGGKLCASIDGSTMESIDPSTGKVITSVPKAGPQDVMKAVEAAKSAQSAWGALSIRCLLYTSPSPRDRTRSRMPSSA